MSAQESIYYGVPMIGIPLFGDQYFNVDTFVQRKIAIMQELDEITEKSFSIALIEILYNPIYKYVKF